jgi:hypothetical protein
VKKVSKRQQRRQHADSGEEQQAKLMMKKFDVSYDAICSLCRLFEKEVELFRMVSKIIRKVIFSMTTKKNGQTELLQISDIYSAMDFQNAGSLTKKRLKTLVFNYAGTGGCELLDADLNAVMRRLDYDGDQEISFSDFFNRLLPYFIYSGLGITPLNQKPPESYKPEYSAIV